MPFPESERVIYDKNPLEKVICELRFPQILRIESEAPAPFQDRIRGDYPLIKKRTPLNLGLPPEVAKIFPLDLNIEGSPLTYDFSSVDNLWVVGLNSGSISLSSLEYRRWEDFKHHLDLPLSAFVELYSPAFYSRVGLRYRNVIRRSRLGLEGSSWSDLLQSYISGLFSSPDVASAIEGAFHQVLIRLPEGAGQVRINHGLATDNETDEVCYVIDNDFFAEPKTEVDNALEKLDLFKKLSARLFRWFITDRLHNAMGPNRIGE